MRSAAYAAPESAASRTLAPARWPAVLDAFPAATLATCVRSLRASLAVPLLSLSHAAAGNASARVRLRSRGKRGVAKPDILAPSPIPEAGGP